MPALTALLYFAAFRWTNLIQLGKLHNCGQFAESSGNYVPGIGKVFGDTFYDLREKLVEKEQWIFKIILIGNRSDRKMTKFRRQINALMAKLFLFLVWQIKTKILTVKHIGIFFFLNCKNAQVSVISSKRTQNSTIKLYWLLGPRRDVVKQYLFLIKT